MDSVWIEYRKRKSIFFISLPLYFIWMIFWSSYFSILIPGFLVGVAIVGVPAALYAKWKCPRCQSPFILKGAFANVLTTKCIHCSLSAYATPEEINRSGYVLKA